jgi:hypothetical protein
VLRLFFGHRFLYYSTKDALLPIFFKRGAKLQHWSPRPLILHSPTHHLDEIEPLLSRVAATEEGPRVFASPRDLARLALNAQHVQNLTAAKFQGDQMGRIFNFWASVYIF